MTILEVSELTKRFGRLAALDRVSFDLAEGEILGLIGPNGAGKTTLVNAVSGAIRDWTGRIRFAGEDLAGRKPYEIGRMGISRTFQVVHPFEGMNALENVVVGALFGVGGGRRSLREARADGEGALASMGLESKMTLSTDRLNVPERKRLEIARALVMRPRLLLLDEVMAGLGVGEMDELMATIRRIRDEGVTILLIEHVMPVISRLADRLVVLDHGEKVAEGAPSEVFRDRQVIQAYLGTRATERGPRREEGGEERP